MQPNNEYTSDPYQDLDYIDNRQQEIISEILDIYREIEDRQKKINNLIGENKTLDSSDKEMNESIESYYLSF